MEFKKLIFVLTIAFILIIGGMWGTTYAYYVSTGGPSVTATTADFDPRLSVIFNQSEYINFKAGIPITASDVDTQASKTVFTLTPDKNILNTSEVAVNINLVDVKIDDALKVSDFKYKLVCNNGTSDINLGSGTGTNITTDTISLGSLSTTAGTFNVNNNYTCTLRVWLQESGSEQNDLMNKKFSGLVKVSTMFKGGTAPETTEQIISFTIDGISYQAVEGMTWGEWIDSQYNTDGFYNNYGIAYTSFGGWIEENGLQMSVNELIIESKAYITGC